MHTTQKIIIFVCLLTTISCVTNPPNSPDVSKTFEKVFISSNITGAEIFVDDFNTGKLTPDTISVEVGSRVIKLVKDNFTPSIRTIEVTHGTILSVDFVLSAAQTSKIVLLEDFANVSCDPCVVSNRIIELIEHYTFDRKKLVVIKYPTNFPSSTDPFFIENPQAATTRINLYNILFVPTIYIDGILKPLPQDSNAVKDKINERLNEPAKFEIVVEDSIGGGQIFVKTTIRVIDISGLDINDLVLHNVVTETNLEFSSPPGSNGETKFYNVMRKMLPSYSGESISALTGNQSIEFNYQTQLNSNWTASNIHVVSFIQNTSTKEVLQAGSTF
jgi:outer membrane protein Omp28/PEGA domain-containing protein